MSPKMPRITASELLRALRRDGWEQVRQSGSHVILKHPTKPGRVTVPQHANVVMKLKTLATILEQAGLTIDDLRDLLCLQAGEGNHEQTISLSVYDHFTS